MINTWFIADLHFGHKNILKYSPETRGHFKDIEEHNIAIVDMLNEYVKPKDHLWILGDVAFGVQNLKYIRWLECNTINLVMGNNDTYNIMDYVAVGFNKIVGMYQYKEFVLTHAPIHTNQVNERYSHNIHGHLHNYNVDDDRYINVNIDMTEFKPKSLIQIRDEIKYNKRNNK